MTATMTNAANGRKRPSLGEQINRLDDMLDGLSEGLNDAVADAVKGAVGAAVKEAVQDVLTDVLTNPEVIARLRAAASPITEPVHAPPHKASGWHRFSGLCQDIRACLCIIASIGGAQVRKTRTVIVNCWQRAIEPILSLSVHRKLVSRFRNHLLLALGVGVTLGGIVWLSGPWLGVVTSAIGGFISTLAVQAGLFLRKMFASDVKQLA